MRLAVQYKYTNCTVDKTTNTDTGHTTNINFITNYNIIITFTLFTVSCCKPLKTDQRREICTCTTWVNPFSPNAYPDKLIYVCYCLRMSITKEVLIENTKEYILEKLVMMLLSIKSSWKPQFSCKWWGFFQSLFTFKAYACHFSTNKKPSKDYGKCFLFHLQRSLYSNLCNLPSSCP